MFCIVFLRNSQWEKQIQQILGLTISRERINNTAVLKNLQTFDIRYHLSNNLTITKKKKSLKDQCTEIDQG